MATDVPSVRASKQAGGWLPGRACLITLALCALIATIANVTGLRGDRGEVNLATMGCAVVAVLALVFWFSFRSRYPRRIRYAFFAVFAIVVVALAASLRVDDVSGEMVPQFRFAWQPAADEQLGELQWTTTPIDLSTTTPLDFPQFLGPNRDGKVDTIDLSENWSETPPKLIWKRPIGAGWSAFAAVNGFAVTMEQRGGDELVTCYEVHTGKPRWAHSERARHETVLGGVGPRSTPTIHDGKVFALGATGVLRCLDGATGALIWKRDLLKELKVPASRERSHVAWGRAGSPLVVNDLVVVPAGGIGSNTRSLVAYDRETGQQVWATGQWQISYSSPSVATIQNRLQIVSVNEDAVSGHDIATGEVLWSFAWPGSSVGPANTSQPLVYQDSIIVTKGYAQGCARYQIDGTNATLVYENSRVLRTKLTSAVLVGDHAFALSDGILECVDVRDGSRKWKSGRYGHGQILLVNDHLLVLSETGELALVEADPDRYRELARIEALDGKTWNNLCLYGRFLLIRNADEAACYELPVK